MRKGLTSGIVQKVLVNLSDSIIYLSKLLGINFTATLIIIQLKMVA